MTARLLPLALAPAFVLAAGLVPGLSGTAFAQAGQRDALARCLDLAGPPDNALPASAQTLAALRAAAPYCDAAIADGTADARVHFLMGVLQQSEGALALAMDHFRTAAWMGLQPGGAGAADEAPGASEAVSESDTEPRIHTRPRPRGGDAPAVAASPRPESATESATAAPVPFAAAADSAESPSEVPTPTLAPPLPARESAASSAPQPAGESAPGAVSEAVSESDETPPPPSPAPNDAQTSAEARCAALAGPPDSGVPVSPAALEQSLAALRLARPFCEQAIAEGTASAETHFQLAVLLQSEGRHEAALAHFREAAGMELAAAHARLGDYALFGIGPVRPDVDAAVSAYRIAAQGGDLAATTTLAFLYRLGRGVPRDPARMLELLSIAADGGYQFAQYRLAQTYLSGDGIPGGRDEALGVPDPERGIRYLERAARQGNPKAILELARLYGDDSGGIPADPEAHAFWVQRAAETGDPAALAALGMLYETGRGVAQDPERAAELYVRALESGKVTLQSLRRGPAGRVPAWDRATAMAFQRILQARGLYDGAIDGIIGPMSARAAAALAP